MLSNQHLISLPEVRTKGLVPIVRHTCLRLSVNKVEGHVSLTGMVSLAPATLDPIPVPPPIASPLVPSDAENIPPACCSNPPPPHAPLVPIEEVMSDAENSDAMVERVEQALDEEVALSFFNRNNQGRGACCQAVHLLSHHTHPYAHRMQPGDHCPRRRGGIFDGLNQQQARFNWRSERGLRGYESSSEGSSYGGDDNIVLDGFPDGRDSKRASDVASSLSLVSLVSGPLYPVLST